MAELVSLGRGPGGSAAPGIRWWQGDEALVMKTAQRWLEETLGRRRLCIGEVVVEKTEGTFRATHRHDQSTSGLQRHQGPMAAWKIAAKDAEGQFRPLKSAPTLVRGWELLLADAAELEEALNFFYPAALGLWLAKVEGRLHRTSLKEYLGRQTGMYRVTGKLENPVLEQVVARTCESESGCLRNIHWSLDERQGVTTLPAEKFEVRETESEEVIEIPVICVEPCSLLLGAAREEAKRK